MGRSLEVDFIKFLENKFSMRGGIGDDCAFLLMGDKYLLINQDSLVEGTHFPQGSPLDLVAEKLLKVNISDILSMGGTPTYCSIGLGCKKIDKEVKSFYSALKILLDHHNIKLIGGDSVFSEQMFFSMTMLGECKIKELKNRKGSQVGDKICVTRTLGKGESSLENYLIGNKLDRDHFKLDLHFKKAKELARNANVTSMMDLSDGLWKDLPALLGDRGANIWVEKIPLHEKAKSMWKEKVFEKVITCGEDFELLYTLKKEEYGHNVIGEVTNDNIDYFLNGTKIIPKKGYQHW